MVALAVCSLWPMLRPLLYEILGYRKARRMADAIATMGGVEAITQSLNDNMF